MARYDRLSELGFDVTGVDGSGRRYDPNAAALVDLETVGASPTTPFLSDVAPGLVDRGQARFASKELNVGRGAVTGGRAFRSPRVRSNMGPEQEAKPMAQTMYPQAVGVPVGMTTVPQYTGPGGEQDYGGLGQGGYTNEEYQALVDMHTGGGGEPTAQDIASGQVGQGFVQQNLVPGMLQSAFNTYQAGQAVGAGLSDYAQAVPGTIAGGVVNAIKGPVGLGLDILGSPAHVSGPIGAVNTIGGLAGTQIAGELGISRAQKDLASTGYTGEISPEALEEGYKAGAPPTTPVGSTGLLGLLGEGVASFFGYDSPIQQAQQAVGDVMYRGPVDIGGAQTGPGYEDKGVIGSTLGTVGSAIGDAISAGHEAIGGYGSKEAAEDAGFTYQTAPSGQISIDPPSMNIGGLDQKLGLSDKTKATNKSRVSQVTAKLGTLTPEEEAIAAKYSKTKKAISKIQKSRREESAADRSKGLYDRQLAADTARDTSGRGRGQGGFDSPGGFGGGGGWGGPRGGEGGGYGF